MRRSHLLLALALLAPLGACGGGGDGAGGGFTSLAGPTELALPVFDDGALKTVVLRNFTAQTVAVSLTRLPVGTVTPVTLQPFAEVRVAPGVLEGWVIVNTLDAATGLPGPGTGFVEAYLRSERSGPDEEVCPAATFQRVEAALPVHPHTDRVLLLNHDVVPRVFTVCTFATASGPPLTVQPYTVGPNAFLSLTDFIALPGRVGQIIVQQSAAPFALASLEDDDLVYAVDDRVGGTPRLLDAGASALATLTFAFGKDAQSGGFEDFDLLVSNLTDDPSPAGFTIRAIYDEFGGAILSTPRTFTLGPRATRLFATTTAASLGLQVGETHPFADLFGDVFAATGYRRFFMDLAIGRGLVLQGRSFDPLTLDFAGRVLPTSNRGTSSVLVSDAQTSLLSGIVNVATFANATSGPITVQVRAFTEVQGTQYLLPSFVIPARGMTDYRLDGLHLKETPGVPTLADVPNLRLLFSSNAPFGTSGRRSRRDASDLLLLVTPHIVRHDN